MKFGSLPLEDCLGAILAHSQKLASGKRLKKGTVLSAEHLELLGDSGVSKLPVAALENDDIVEDEAALRIGQCLQNPSLRVDAPFTGRVNVFAVHSGVFRVNASIIDQINRIDPAITIATLADYSEVNAGRLIATVKIIPYAVNSNSLAKAIEVASSETCSVLRFTSMRVGVVATRLPSLKEKVMDKTVRILARRLELSGSTITGELRVDHESGQVANAVKQLNKTCDLIILFGASAISDIRDVIPAGLVDAGGTITRFGMPVDPGNLLLLGELNSKPVIGAPGCARSPAENGFDMVLQRVLAGITVTDDTIMGMGVGGLLSEIGSRPQPREKSSAVKMANVSVIILAAGQSRRMGSSNKLLARLNNKTLIRHVVEAASAAKGSVGETVVVIGHEGEQIKKELADFDIRFVENPDYADGLSTSLAAGIGAVGDGFDAAIVMLGDMPDITGKMIDKMCGAMRAASDDAIIMATHDGKRGNPVIWPSRYFPALKSIEGDTGARHIIGENQENVIEVELGKAASFDLDTPEALQAVGGVLEL